MSHDAGFSLLLLWLIAQLAPAASCQVERPGPGPESSRTRTASRPTRQVGYAVIEFGRQGERRIPFQVDGAVFRVDRNADGDLEDSGERVLPDERGEFVTDVRACREDGREARYQLTVGLERRQGTVGIAVLSACPVGDIQHFHSTAGFIPLGRDRSHAPTLPIHGALGFVLMDHWTGSTACRTLPRRGGKHELSILVATPVRATDREAYVYPNLWVLEGARLPTVRVDVVDRAGGTVSAPDLEVWQCECARRYRCSFTAPPATAAVRASVRIAFPGWRHGPLSPVTLDLPYAAEAKSEVAPVRGAFPAASVKRRQAERRSALVVMGAFAAPWTEAEVRGLLAPVVGDGVELLCHARPGR